MGFWGKRQDERRDDRQSLNDEQAIERYPYIALTFPVLHNIAQLTVRLEKGDLLP